MTAARPRLAAARPQLVAACPRLVAAPLRLAAAPLLLAAALLPAAGCRPLAKPVELAAFEQLRRQPDPTRERRQKSELARTSEAAYAQAVAAWQDDDLRGARYHARAGSAQLRTAVALREERALRAQIAGLWGQLNRVQAEEAKVKEALSQLDEMVQLYEELASAQSSALEKTLHLTEVQQSAEAVRQLEQARLTLKMAELVGAARYARTLTDMARALVEQAGRELEKQQSTKARATATLAHRKAQEAYAAARPRYLKERAAAARRAQNQALQQELTALAATSRWLSVKLQARGGAQELVVPVQSLFLPLSTKPLPARLELVDKLAARLKRYPDHHLVIRGYTSRRAPRATRLKISRLRARRVADRLVAAGLDEARLSVRGEAAARPVAPGRSTLNDRVEICVLLR